MTMEENRQCPVAYVGNGGIRELATDWEELKEWLLNEGFHRTVNYDIASNSNVCAQETYTREGWMEKPTFSNITMCNWSVKVTHKTYKGKQRAEAWMIDATDGDGSTVARRFSLNEAPRPELIEKIADVLGI